MQTQLASPGVLTQTTTPQGFVQEGKELTCREAVVEIAKILNQCHGLSPSPL